MLLLMLLLSSGSPSGAVSYSGTTIRRYMLVLGGLLGSLKHPGGHPPPNTYTIPNTRARVNTGGSQESHSWDHLEHPYSGTTR